jgi:protein SCO1
MLRSVDGSDCGLRRTLRHEPAAVRAMRLTLAAGLLTLALTLALTLPGTARATEAAGRAVPAVPESAGAVIERQPGEVPRLDEQLALGLAQAAIGRQVPDLMLLDVEGRPVRLASYAGKPLLVSFIYTGCFQVCPTQTRALHEAVRGLQRMLGEHQFNVVSIGFNQPFDSPQAMRSFARQHRIQESNWAFLSPPRDAVKPLTQAFGFSYVATPAGFDHVLGVSVVDARGRIHDQVFGDKLRADQLGRPLRQLLLDTPLPSAPVSTLSAVVERVRILCTVYDPDTGEYRYDWKLIYELIGGALFFGSVLVYGLIEWRSRRRSKRVSSCQTSAPALIHRG